MNTKLTLTPVSNIDYSTMKVIDNSLISIKNYTWEDVVQVYNTKKEIVESTRISAISLYDDRLYISDSQHHILHMFSYS